MKSCLYIIITALPPMQIGIKTAPDITFGASQIRVNDH